MKVTNLLILLAGVLVLQACGSEEPRLPSATENVSILKQQFIIPVLNRERTIRLYLPSDYQTSDKRYPVLYMHDGQNLFDDATSYAGEWGVDEALNKLEREKSFSLIVVGIDNGGEKRMNELSPWPNDDFGAAEGKFYMDFIVDVVKPNIDAQYRTLPEPENTAILGSSMGGLISHYAAFEYPRVFSKVGIFSPSYWFSDTVYPFSKVPKLGPETRLYLVAGEKEGRDVIRNMQTIVASLKAQGLPEQRIFSQIAQGGEHHESSWRSQFEDAVLWLFEIY